MSAQSTPPIVPNFFVVGAAKCGTTSLCNYLGQHPDVFISEEKEPMYFCRDEGHHEPWMVTSLENYLALFSIAGEAKAIGEGSVWYLESTKAPSRIKEFNPAAKIVIMLRNPADMVISLHGQFLFSGNESVRDFSTAYALSTARKRGKKIPIGAHFPGGLCYAEVPRYVHKVRRYLDTFGAENVKIIIFEEFVSDIERGYADVLRFLGVDDSFTADFSVLNERRHIRSIPLQRILYKANPIWDFNWVPVRSVRESLRWRVGGRIRQALFRWNIVKGRRNPVSSKLREMLRQEFRGDVEALEKLLSRDLSVWK